MEKTSKKSNCCFLYDFIAGMCPFYHTWSNDQWRGICLNQCSYEEQTCRWHTLVGTDILGRDLFSRVCVGARASLIVAIACTFIQIVVGCAYGGIMAYFGGWLDEVMMRIVEILTSIPSLLLTLLIMMVLGQNMGALLVAMCLTSWCGTARQCVV